MPKTILIVEDDEDTRAIYEAALSARGYSLLIATQGAEGFHLARRERPDLILLDIRMPIMDGWQAVEYLRSFPETKNIPICAISAYRPPDEELRHVAELEFDCFLMKPVDPKEIVAAVERAIGPPDQDALPSG